MKLTLQTQLLPTDAQAAALGETLRAFNAAADWLAGEAFTLKLANKIDLQKRYYHKLRDDFGLSAQMAVRCIAQVCEAYKRDKTRRPHFREFAAMPFDQRMMSFRGETAVSLLTLAGREVVALVMGDYQRKYFDAPRGQCDLLRRHDGKWFLLVTVELSPPAPVISEDFLGVDLGVTNLATDSDGEHHSGEEVEACRVHYQERRRRLQQAAAARKRRGRRPRAIRRKLKSLAGGEARFRRDVNHRLSKRLVAKAKGSDRGLALEDLRGIRDRTRFRRQQRARMGRWAFHQLRGFVEYKAQRAGVEWVLVDPHDTSRGCMVCGHTDRANRPSQAEFRCVVCGHTDHADVNAARNIRARARALVNAPKVSEPHQGLPRVRSTGTSFAL